MTKFSVGRPFGEFDLCHELRANPVGLLIGPRPLAERAVFRLERLEQLHQPRELLLVEPGARVSNVDEVIARGRLCVYPEKERTEVRARLPRLGPAADDEL